jgi:predicted nuclease of predicted toxin-antitoxin system
MKILLDTCVWGGVKYDLIATGHDVIWTGDWPVDPGDEDILAYAYRDERVLVTLDKDFGELAIVFGRPHAGIIRLVSLSALRQAQICQSILTKYVTELQAGAMITAEYDRVRIRMPK